jgi:hypothetical protein
VQAAATISSEANALADKVGVLEGDVAMREDRIHELEAAMVVCSLTATCIYL